jgi:hypothetical protein
VFIFFSLSFFIFFSLAELAHHPYDSLAKSGYNPDMKILKSLSICHIFANMLHPIEKSGNFSTQKIWILVP